MRAISFDPAIEVGVYPGLLVETRTVICGSSPEVGVRCGQTVFDGTGALTGYNTIHDASDASVAGAKPAWGSLTPATEGG